MVVAISDSCKMYSVLHVCAVCSYTTMYIKNKLRFYEKSKAPCTGEVMVTHIVTNFVKLTFCFGHNLLLNLHNQG